MMKITSGKNGRAAAIGAAPVEVCGVKGAGILGEGTQ